MNDAIVPQIKRRRGRPRKNVNQPAINKFPTFIPQTNISPHQRRPIPLDLSDDIQVIGFNGYNDDPSLAKKPKLDDDQPKRHLPPRRARFTESYGGTNDVVVISDEDRNDDSESESDSDCEPIPSPVLKVKSKHEQEEYDANIERLKKELSDEEMKLVLLRKLKDSQKSKDLKREANDSPLPTVNFSNKSAVTLKGGVQIAPMPSKQLLSNKYLAAKKDIKPDANSGSLSKSSPSLFKPIQPSFKSTSKPIKPESTSSVSSTVAEQLNSNHLNQYPLLKNLSNQITITPVPPPTTSNHTNAAKHEERNNDAETLQQRQAAAKLALRKQLEKTLLQIPLPKPPPLKINFFPNPNSMEFLCLLGLDFIVDFMTKTKKLPQKEPLICAQCSTDFTCAWKWKEVDRNGKKAYDVFCEACITSNIRKSLKAQHTNNLKSAFLKALQQEKEIDRLSLSALPKAEPTPQPPPRQSSSRPTHRPAPAHQHQLNSSMSAFSVPKTSAMQMPMPYIPKSAGMNMNHAAALAQLSKLSPQYQSLLQAQAQQLLAAGVPLHPSVLSLSPFMQPSVLNHNHHSRSKSKGDGRRQHYRSDRVQSPSIPQASSSWKA